MGKGDRLFGDMSRQAHAYALGVVAAKGRVRRGVLEIRLRGDGRPLMDMLAADGPEDIPALYEVQKRRVRIFTPLGDLAAGWLGGAPGDKVRLRFPNLREELSWAFVRGIFDASGTLSPKHAEILSVVLDHPGDELLQGLLDFVAIPPGRIGRRTVRWEGNSALDLLGHLYDECAAERLALQEDDPDSGPRPSAHGPAPYRQKHLDRYLAWTHRIVQLSGGAVEPQVIHWSRVHPDARAPFKERVTDSGYDLTLLYEKKRFGNRILYGTGLVIEPPFGWYFDVVPRSSIIKTGYMLANNVGVIDRGYRGELMVPLVKIDPTAPDLELPARVAQMVPRPIAHFSLVHRKDATATHRGAGGFGSTG